jgi:hypothetical protein
MSKICNGLIKENYEYQLSGDCLSSCHCMLTDKRCVGITVEDSEDRSSQFFSRGKNVVNEDKLIGCPVYGCSVETFERIVREKAEMALNKKMATLKP